MKTYTYACSDDDVFGDASVAPPGLELTVPAGMLIFTRVAQRATDDRSWAETRFPRARGCDMTHAGGLREQVYVVDHVANDDVSDRWTIGWTVHPPGGLGYGGVDQYIQIGRLVAVQTCVLPAAAPAEVDQVCAAALRTFVAKLIALVKR